MSRRGGKIFSVLCSELFYTVADSLQAPYFVSAGAIVDESMIAT